MEKALKVCIHKNNEIYRFLLIFIKLYQIIKDKKKYFQVERRKIRGIYFEYFHQHFNDFDYYIF